MEFFKPNLAYDIMGKQKYFITISVILVLSSLISMVVKGFNYGIDFAGGTEMQFKFNPEIKVTTKDIREALSKVNLANSEVQEFSTGGGKEFIVRIEDSVSKLKALEADIKNKLKSSIGSLLTFTLRNSEDGFLKFNKDENPENIKSVLSRILPQNMEIEYLKPFGKEDDFEYNLRFKGTSTRINQILLSQFGPNSSTIERVEMVGPKVGEELRKKGLYAVLISWFFILIYIAFRFEMKFAPGAVIALIHDVTITAGVFSLFGLEFNLQIVAALLTLIGFSINDTIVVYDRIRDNIKKIARQNLTEIINISVNQTFSRTILTSLTVLIITTCMLFIGGRIIRDFSLALTVGIIVGTYSSIFIASPITILLDKILINKKLR